MSSAILVLFLPVVLSQQVLLDVPVDKQIQDIFGGLHKLENTVAGLDGLKDQKRQYEQRKMLHRLEGEVEQALPAEVNKLERLFEHEESADQPLNFKHSDSEGSILARKLAKRTAFRLGAPEKCGAKVSINELGIKNGPAASRFFKGASLLQQEAAVHGDGDEPDAPAPGPGAGGNQVPADEGRSKMGSSGGVEPFTTVFKDGVWLTGCVYDKMFKDADKFGANRFSYKEHFKFQNVSIAVYDDMVLKERQKKMNSNVCFEFCRTIEGMNFFGMTAGRTCYCMPFYQAGVGGDDMCDQVCEGDTTNDGADICGGKEKSNIYQMHSCHFDEADVAIAATKVAAPLSSFYTAAFFSAKLSDALQASGAKLEEVAGKYGDSGASNMGMDAKQHAGDVEHAAMTGTPSCLESYTILRDAYEEAQGNGGRDLKKSTALHTAEEGLRVMERGGPVVQKCADALMKDVQVANPAAKDSLKAEHDGALTGLETKFGNALATYFPLNHVLDSKGGAQQSVCTGERLATPAVGTAGQCAQACDDLVYPDKCVGFQFFKLTGEGTFPLCFLFKEFSTMTTYKCDFLVKAAKEDDSMSSLAQTAALRGAGAGGPACGAVRAFVQHSGVKCTEAFGSKHPVLEECPEVCHRTESAETGAVCMVKLASVSSAAGSLKKKSNDRCFGGSDNRMGAASASPFLLPSDDGGMIISGDVNLGGADILEPQIWTH